MAPVLLTTIEGVGHPLVCCVLCESKMQQDSPSHFDDVSERRLCNSHQSGWRFHCGVGEQKIQIKGGEEGAPASQGVNSISLKKSPKNAPEGEFATGICISSSFLVEFH